MEDENNNDESMTKLRVRVPVEFEVDYVIEVEDPDNVDEIQEKLLDTDASRWESDPQFYERLGDDWYSFVRKVTKEHIEKVV
jgi:hypothetical protein